MVRNLAKAPLVAVAYGSILWFVVFFLPRSGTYSEAAAEFTMPVTGLLFLLLYALVVAAILALVYSFARKGGVGLFLMLVVSTLGLQWLSPNLRQLMLGEATGVMTLSDTLFQLAGGFAATVLALVLAMLLYRTPAEESREPEFHLQKLGLVIRLLVLPVIYFVLYYLSWYFLFWRREAAHTYHGVENVGNFMAEFINVLVNQGSQAAITLLVGLVYAAFCLPLLLRMQGRLAPYMAAVTLLYLTGALFYLIPNPVMPYSVRILHFVETGALMVVYGLLSGLLLSTAFAEEELPEPVPATRPQQRQGQRRPAGPQPRPAQAAKPAPVRQAAAK